MKKTNIFLFSLFILFCFTLSINAQDYYEDETENEEYYYEESDDSEISPFIAVFDFECGDGFSWVDANDATSYLRVSILEHGSLQIPSYESLKSTLDVWSLDVDNCRYMYEYAVEASRLVGADFFVMGEFNQIKKRYIVKGTVYAVWSGEELFSIEITSDKKAELNPTLDELAESLIEDLPEYYYLLEDESEDINSDEVDEYVWDLPEEEESTEIDWSIYEDEDASNDTQDDNFCEAITEIMAESYNNFAKIQGEEISVEGDVIKIWKYKTNLTLQAADECYIQFLMGSSSYRADLGTYNQKSVAEEVCEDFMNKINSCLGNSIYYNLKTGDNSISYSIGKKGTDYFSSTIMNISMYKTNNDMFGTYMSASKPTADKIFSVPYSYGSNDELFEIHLKKQMSNAYNNFENIRGEKHVEESIWEVKIYYDINAKLPGSNSCIFNETGGFLFKSCKSEFYSGDSELAAVELYDELAQKIKDALGSDYVYRIKEIYENNPKGNMIFAKESELDVDTPVVILKARESFGTYYVEIEVDFNSFTGIGL